MGPDPDFVTGIRLPFGVKVLHRLALFEDILTSGEFTANAYFLNNSPGVLKGPVEDRSWPSRLQVLLASLL